MKSTGIVRRIDELGRVVLPKELRITLNIHERDPLEIYVDEDGGIILKKSESACVFCSSKDDVLLFKGQSVCRQCMEKMVAKLEE